MILYGAITITVFYYLFLWRVQSKKAELDRAAKEALGPFKGIQELLDSKTGQLVVNEESSTACTTNEISIPSEEIFGPVTNIKKPINTDMPSSTITDIPPLSAIADLTDHLSPNENLVEIKSSQEAQGQDTQEVVRHRIFAGSSLEKEEATITPATNIAVKNRVTRLKAQNLTKELKDIVEMLNEESTKETETHPTTSLQVDDFSPSLKNSDLVDQLHQLFKKDYQGYT